MALLYREFATQTEIDAQYDVDLSVSDYGPYARHYADASRETRARLGGLLDVPYGPTRDETLDVFPARTAAAAPVFVFLHGGYWRSLSSKEFSCVAAGPHALGVTSVVVNYSLTPKVGLDEITRQARAAVAWTLRNIEGHGGDARRIVIGGHSAGAQLAAMCLHTDWEGEYGIAADPLAGAILVSGIYDLHPLRYSAMQPQLQLDEDVIRRNSPLFHARASSTPIVLAWGADETAEFQRQSQAYLAACRVNGIPAQAAPQTARNHFDVIGGFEDPGSTLCRWASADTHATASHRFPP